MAQLNAARPNDTVPIQDNALAPQVSSTTERGAANDVSSTGAALFFRGVAALRANQPAEAADLLNKAISVRRALAHRDRRPELRAVRTCRRPIWNGEL